MNLKVRHSGCLARSADGSMRDALSLTDQAIAFGAGSVREADVRTMLGTIDQRLVYRMLEQIARQQPAQVLEAVRELSEFSPDYLTVAGGYGQPAASHCTGAGDAGRGG